MNKRVLKRWVSYLFILINFMLLIVASGEYKSIVIQLFVTVLFIAYTFINYKMLNKYGNL